MTGSKQLSPSYENENRSTSINALNFIAIKLLSQCFAARASASI